MLGTLSVAVSTPVTADKDSNDEGQSVHPTGSIPHEKPALFLSKRGTSARIFRPCRLHAWVYRGQCNLIGKLAPIRHAGASRAEVQLSPPTQPEESKEEPTFSELQPVPPGREPPRPNRQNSAFRCSSSNIMLLSARIWVRQRPSQDDQPSGSADVG